jgi:hypothetical protein
MLQLREGIRILGGSYGGKTVILLYETDAPFS